MRIKVKKTVIVRLSKEVSRRVERLFRERKCLGCERQIQPVPVERPIRGCCRQCYAAIRRVVTTYRADEMKLIKQGKILSGGRTGRRPSNHMAIELTQ